MKFRLLAVTMMTAALMLGGCGGGGGGSDKDTPPAATSGLTTAQKDAIAKNLSKTWTGSYTLGDTTSTPTPLVMELNRNNTGTVEGAVISEQILGEAQGTVGDDGKVLLVIRTAKGTWQMELELKKDGTLEIGKIYAPNQSTYSTGRGTCTAPSTSTPSTPTTPTAPDLTLAQREAIAANVVKTWTGSYTLNNSTGPTPIKLNLTQNASMMVGGEAESAHFKGAVGGHVDSQGIINLSVITLNGTWNLELTLNKNGTLSINKIYAPNQGASSVGSGSCTASAADTPKPQPEPQPQPQPEIPDYDDEDGLDLKPNSISAIWRYDHTSRNYVIIANYISSNNTDSVSPGTYRSAEDYDLVFKAGQNRFTARITKGTLGIPWYESYRTVTTPYPLVSVEAGQYVGNHLLTERHIGFFDKEWRYFNISNGSFFMMYLFPESTRLTYLDSWGYGYPPPSSDILVIEMDNIQIF